MHTPIGLFQIRNSCVKGVLAELLSVLESRGIWSKSFAAEVPLEELLRSLDTRKPPEERVTAITLLSRRIQLANPVARWIPWHSSLFDYEYSNHFYPAYRDHTIHTLQVFLLGLYLFETSGILREPLIEHLRQKAPGNNKTDTELFLTWWTLTAFWHDTGYPFESSDYISNKDVRDRILCELSENLLSDPFGEALQVENLCTPPNEKRSLYQQGRYFPATIASIRNLIQGKHFADRTAEMWHRLGLGLEYENPAAEIDSATTQEPKGRPAYHDHGIAGGALLSFLAEEAHLFLSNLADSATAKLQQDHPAITLDSTLDIWQEFVDASGLVDLAVEAISFHNIEFSRPDESPITSLATPGFRLNLPLQDEPHLFFLAITDTLQDWDRHHYAPRTGALKYRGFKPSESILVQGAGDKIRIRIEEEKDSKKKTISLFEGWLCLNDLDRLFDDAPPTFSAPELIQAAETTTLNALERSRNEKDRLLSKITTASHRAKDLLLSNRDDSIVESGKLLTAMIRETKRSHDILSLSDKEDVESHLKSEGIEKYRRMAYGAIEEGCRLELGTVKTKLGEGGFGVVWEIESGDRNGKRYAFKLYREYELSNTEKMRLFRRGYDAMQELSSHENVVSVHQFSEVPLGFYMDLVSGPNLADGISIFSTIQERLDVAMLIAETLADAHNLPTQVLHRDIKPANVLLDAEHDYRPVVTDFDLAWIDSHYTQDTSLLYANLHYGAPEQFEKRYRDYQRRPTVDIYSLGALLYFIVLQQDPPHWRAWSEMHWSSMQERLSSILSAEAASKLTSLIQKMTEVDPAARVERMEDVVTELSAVRAAAAASSQAVEVDKWKEQVVFKVTRGASRDASSFVGRNGAIRWSLAARTLQNEAIVRLSAGLVHGPRYEGVKYQNYRKRSVKRIDERLRKLEQILNGSKATRTGFPTETSTANIEIRLLDYTLQSANIIADLVKQIGRALT